MLFCNLSLYKGTSTVVAVMTHDVSCLHVYRILVIHRRPYKDGALRWRSLNLARRRDGMQESRDHLSPIKDEYLCSMSSYSLVRHT